MEGDPAGKAEILNMGKQENGGKGRTRQRKSKRAWLPKKITNVGGGGVGNKKSKVVGEPSRTEEE